MKGMQKIIMNQGKGEREADPESIEKVGFKCPLCSSSTHASPRSCPGQFFQNLCPLRWALVFLGGRVQ